MAPARPLHDELVLMKLRTILALKGIKDPGHLHQQISSLLIKEISRLLAVINTNFDRDYPEDRFAQVCMDG